MARYEEIAKSLEQDIRSGKISGKLPSEKELASSFSVAGMTMSRAIDALKSRGLVRQVHRRGTFVVPPEKKVLRLLKSSCVYFAGKNQDKFLEGFPDVSFEIVHSLDEADIAVFPTILPMNYSSHFMPWPQEIIRKLRESGKYFDQAFEFHHIGTPVYAVAYSLCPSLLAYNREVVEKYVPDFSPDSFSFDEMVKLLELLPYDMLPDMHGTNRLLLSLAYDAGSLDRALENFKKLRLSAKAPQTAGEKRVFSIITRRDIFTSEPDSRYDFMPMPEFNSHRFCHPVSESVFVPLNSRYPEIAFQLAASTLSDRFQKVVADSLDNLPANISIARSCVNSKVRGDEMFFNEVKSIHYPREIIDPLSTAVILMGLKEFAGNRLPLKEFQNLLKNEKESIKRRREAINNILGNIFSF